MSEEITKVKVPQQIGMTEVRLGGMTINVSVSSDDERSKQVVELGGAVQVGVKRSYSETWDVHPGILLDFADFADAPIFTVAYLDLSAADPVNIIHIRADKEDADAGSTKYRIAPFTAIELSIEKDEVMAKADRSIATKERELERLIKARAILGDKLDAIMAKAGK